MSDFGQTLRAAREARGLTTKQIAEQTHMMVQTVEGLENEDFAKIVAPIYGRGFVKLYCEAVGLEPKPLVEAFMSLYNGAKSGSAKSKKPRREPPPPEKPRAPVLQEPAPAAQPTLGADLDLAPPPAAPAKPPLSRYAPPLRPEAEARGASGTAQPALRFVNWRIVALVAVAFAVLLCAGLLVRTVYRATMTPAAGDSAQSQPQETPQAQSAPEEAQPAGNAGNSAEAAPAGAQTDASGQQAAEAAPAKRTPLPLKPFYIDSDHATLKEQKDNPTETERKDK